MLIGVPREPDDAAAARARHQRAGARLRRARRALRDQCEQREAAARTVEPAGLMNPAARRLHWHSSYR